uniref:Uncharacterized protein n=1 Tax=Sphaerodactylus townsendi TaxID=933632 RepID=A0ACB8GAX5_9SAUR
MPLKCSCTPSSKQEYGKRDVEILSDDMKLEVVFSFPCFFPSEIKEDQAMLITQSLSPQAVCFISDASLGSMKFPLRAVASAATSSQESVTQDLDYQSIPPI